MFRTMLAATSALTLLSSAAIAQERIQIDTAVNGRLATGDQTLPSGEYVDVFLLEGKAGERVNIRVLGAGFDSYIMVRGPNGFSRDNDDMGGGELDAGLEFRVPRDGEYEIGVTSYEPGETGEYRLRLGSGALPRSSSNRLSVGETASGTLTLDDSRLDDGELVDRWRFRPRRGRSYQVEMSSSGFDSYLMVRDEDDLSLDNDDNPYVSNSRDSRINFTAPDSGELTISATSYRSGETGDYTLRIIEAPAPPPPPRVDYPPVAFGQTVDGVLAEGDRRLKSDEYTDRFAYEGRAGQRIKIGLMSTEFDPYLIVDGPGDFSIQNDDATADSKDSRLVIELPTDGRYLISATTYEAGETGAYRLMVSDAGDQAATERPAPAADAATPAPRPIELGRTEGGFLEAGDATMNSGEFVDRYVFTGRAGQTIRLALGSTGFDTYVILDPPVGEQLDNDDAGGDGTDSALETTLAHDGVYTVLVTSYEPGETGGYSLTVDSR